MEIIKFVQSQTPNENEQAKMLAALVDAPGEDFEPKMPLPVQNEIPAYKLGDDSIGSILANQNKGIPAPIPNMPEQNERTIGQLLTGEE